jgi:hypothetical protein
LASPVLASGEEREKEWGIHPLRERTILRVTPPPLHEGS